MPRVYCFGGTYTQIGLFWWLSGKKSACQCRRLRFDPWSRKIPWTAGELRLFTTAANPVCLELCSATKEATTMRSLCTTDEVGEVLIYHIVNILFF